MCKLEHSREEELRKMTGVHQIQICQEIHMPKQRQKSRSVSLVGVTPPCASMCTQERRDEELIAAVRYGINDQDI